MKVFFFNPSTKTSVWERPSELKGRSDVDKLLKGPPDVANTQPQVAQEKSRNNHNEGNVVKDRGSSDSSDQDDEDDELTSKANKRNKAPSNKNATPNKKQKWVISKWHWDV